MIKAGTWVLIQTDLLKPEERSATLPEATKRVPLRMWLKGTLREDADLQTDVRIQTVTGRIASGRLVEAHPRYRHDFGLDCPELRKVRDIVFEAMTHAEVTK